MIISVVVPVFNAQDYIQRCAESILQQTYERWEAIFVDDGSTDKSLEILNNLSARDNRIKVFHQENAGAGAARNKGLSLVSGDYVVFVDVDDYIASEYFELLADHSEDVVFIDAQAVDRNGRALRKETMSSFKNKGKDGVIRCQMTGYMSWGGWRKAARYDLIKQNNITYSNHTVGEEAIYSFNLLNNAKSVAFIEEPLYNYVIREDSLSHTKLDDAWGAVAINLREYIKSIDETKQKGYSHYANTINAFILSAFSGSIRRLCVNYPYFQFLKKAKERRKLFFEQIDKNYPIDYQHLSVKARVLGFCSIHRLYPIVWILTKCYSRLHK